MRHRHVLHITFFVLFPSLLFGKRDFKAVKSSLSPDSSALPASTSSGEFDAASTAQLDSQFLLQLAGPTAPTVQVPLTFAPAPGPSPTNISRRSLAEVNRDAPVYRIPTSDGVVSGRSLSLSRVSSDLGQLLMPGCYSRVFTRKLDRSCPCSRMRLNVFADALEEVMHLLLLLLVLGEGALRLFLPCSTCSSTGSVLSPTQQSSQERKCVMVGQLGSSGSLSYIFLRLRGCQQFTTMTGGVRTLILDILHLFPLTLQYALLQSVVWRTSTVNGYKGAR